MITSENYSPKKLFGAIRHYDGLPLLSKDIHEYADTIRAKTAYLVDSIIKSGVLNSPSYSLDGTSIKVDRPIVSLVEGDVSLIYPDEGLLYSTDALEETDNLLCAVGWYQHILAGSTIRAYGGVNNEVVDNDLLDNPFHVQVSTRYQFCWDIVHMSAEDYQAGLEVSFDLKERDESGIETGSIYSLTAPADTSKVRVISNPATVVPYAVSDLYIIPLCTVSGETIEAYQPTRPAGSGFVVEAEEPTGPEFETGDAWYDTTNEEIKFFIEGKGFISVANYITADDTEELDSTLPKDADTLQGHPASYFASKTEVNLAIANYVNTVLGSSY